MHVAPMCLSGFNAGSPRGPESWHRVALLLPRACLIDSLSSIFHALHIRTLARHTYAHFALTIVSLLPPYRAPSAWFAQGSRAVKVDDSCGGSPGGSIQAGSW